VWPLSHASTTFNITPPIVPSGICPLLVEDISPPAQFSAKSGPSKIWTDALPRRPGGKRNGVSVHLVSIIGVVGLTC
jgi:hypothetical protein